MSKRLDLIGKTFSRLTVIRRAKNGDHNRTRFWCECVCKKMIRSYGADLVSGNTKSCGCIKKLNRRLRSFEALYRKLCCVAKARHHEVSLTYEDFLEFTEVLECSYCGLPVVWAEFNVNLHSAACNLDRKDSRKGYSVKNCAVCCRRCNVMKNDMNVKQFIAHMERILKRV